MVHNHSYPHVDLVCEMGSHTFYRVSETFWETVTEYVNLYINGILGS